MKIVCWWSLKPNEFLICITDKFLLKPSLHVQGTSRRPDWQFCHQRKWNQVSVWVWNYSFLIYGKFDMLILIILTFTKNICGRTIINQLNAKYIDIQMQEGKTNENYLNIIILRIYWLILFVEVSSRWLGRLQVIRRIRRRSGRSRGRHPGSGALDVSDGWAHEPGEWSAPPLHVAEQYWPEDEHQWAATTTTERSLFIVIKIQYNNSNDIL